MAVNGGIKGKINKPSHGGNTVTTLTSSATFTAQQTTNEIDVLVVAGGGSGGASTSGEIMAGGGGAGGFQNLTGQPIKPGDSFAVTVGAGGAAAPAPASSNVQGNDGSNSVWANPVSPITSTGGGGGGGGEDNSTDDGRPGGSGGGAAYAYNSGSVKGDGTAGQGNDGGVSSLLTAGGGGGAGAAGQAGGTATSSEAGGDGGAGSPSTITNTATLYAGGGGGASYGKGTGTPSPAGGAGSQMYHGQGGDGGGGFGNHAPHPSAHPSGGASGAGTANTGGGGGGGAGVAPGSVGADGTGAAGGSGIVIVKEKDKASGVWNMKNQYSSRIKNQWPDPNQYEVTNSLRFNDDDTPKLSRSVSTSGSARKATLSVWIKRGNLGSRQQIYSNKTADSGFSAMNMYFNASNDRLYIDHHDGSSNISIYTTRVFRDVSAWYHIVHTIDTTEATATNRLRIYVNGEEITDFATDQNPSQNADLALSHSTGDQSIGDDPRDGSDLFDGYMAEYYFIDGLTLHCGHFGEPDPDNPKIWRPKKYEGNFSGINTFFLEFKQTGTSQNSSGIGADTSGNNNHFAVTNLTSLDVTEDTPTNNFCTLNPLDPIQGAVYSEGNCKTVTNSSNRNYVTGTFGLTSGKWYWEAKLTAVTSNQTDQAFFGIADLDDRGANSTGQSLGDRENEVGWHQEEGKFQRNNSFSDGSTAGDSASWGIGDICAIALDADNNRVTIAKNGQWADGSGNADESNPTSFVSYNASTMTPAMGEGGGGTEATWECNFGNPVFSISSGNSDANGYGNFEYAVPSGYYSLCTKNLAQYG